MHVASNGENFEGDANSSTSPTADAMLDICGSLCVTVVLFDDIVFVH